MARRGLLPFAAGSLLLAAVLGLGVGALLGEGAASAPAAELPPTPTTSASATPTPTPAAVTAAPDQATAAPGSRVYVRGSVTGVPAGTPMVLQRLDGGSWTDFPAHTAVNSTGSYQLWFMTSRSGPGSWRMAVPGTGQASAPFTVTIG